MGGRKSKDKGYRFERAIVQLLQDHGRAAERMPLSGALADIAAVRTALGLPISDMTERPT